MGFDADYAERRNCRGGAQARIRQRRHCDGFDQPRGVFDRRSSEARRGYGGGVGDSENLNSSLLLNRELPALDSRFSLTCEYYRNNGFPDLYKDHRSFGGFLFKKIRLVNDDRVVERLELEPAGQGRAHEAPGLSCQCVRGFCRLAG